MKRIFSFFLALLLLSSLSVVAVADVSFEGTSPSITESALHTDEPTRQEETVWYFRTYEGMWQMRLWSITYERWLTDWIDIGPA